MFTMLAKEVLNRWVRYKVYEIYHIKFQPTCIEMSVLSTETVSEKDYFWWQLAGYEGGNLRYAIKLLTDNFDFLSTDASDTDIARYIFYENGRSPIEYINTCTGRALLPGFGFIKNLLPHASLEASEFPFFEVGNYLGHPIHLVEQGIGAVDRVPQAKELILNPELLIGTGRNYRNAEDRRLYYPGRPKPPERPNYAFVKITTEEYDEMIDDVGSNIFTVDAEQREYILERPVFFISKIDDAAMPELLYRSNYKGVTMFMDEPAVIIRDLDDAKKPSEAANRLVEGIRSHARTGRTYGIRALDNLLSGAGYDFGGLVFPQEFPVWETVPSATWYELKAGLNGYVHESRFRPNAFAKEVKETFGVDFPPTTYACIDFRYAWFRGAARRFNKPWGMAIYGQMDLDVAPLVFQRAYDQGAEYLWFWTSDHEHHVPYSEQKAHTKALRRYEADNPRPSPARSLLEKSKVAVALPYGYLLDDWVMGKKALWNNPTYLGLDKKNSSGATYGEVLTIATEEICKYLNEDVLFDLVYWGGGEEIKGYEEVRKVGEDGTIKSCRSC